MMLLIINLKIPNCAWEKAPKMIKLDTKIKIKVEEVLIERSMFFLDKLVSETDTMYFLM